MSEARILDRGYRRYEGRRLGVGHAFRSLTVHSMQRALGMRRRARYKILPLAVIVISFVPAIVILGLTVLLPEFPGGPEYHEYYGIINTAIILFAAFVGPEVLCTDRRSGILSLYLSSPLTKVTYALAKIVAVGLLFLTITAGPLLLLLIGLALRDQGPSGVVGFLTVLGRILASGVVVSAFYTFIALAISSMTPRRAFAATGIVLTIFITLPVAILLIGTLEAPSWVALFSLAIVPFQAVNRIFGIAEPDREMRSIATWAVAVATAGWVTLAALVLWDRLRRLRVTR